MGVPFLRRCRTQPEKDRIRKRSNLRILREVDARFHAIAKERGEAASALVEQWMISVIQAYDASRKP